MSDERTDPAGSYLYRVMNEWKELPGLLADKQIRHLCTERDMITPFVDSCVSNVDGVKVISYGLSSYGYDCRLGPEFKVFTNVDSALIDVKNFDEKALVERTGEYCIIPPNSFVLGRTIERFKIPRDVLMICLGKSTYARAGIIVNVTPGEPEWEGFLTLEFSNTTSLPVKLYAHEGCCQMLFFRGSVPCEVSYKDRGGKYQGQAAVPTVARLKT